MSEPNISSSLNTADAAFPNKKFVSFASYLSLLCLLSFFFSLSMSSLARRSTSVISASMDMGTGEEPGGWPGAGLRVEAGNGEREESRPTCRRSDSFMDSLSRSLVLVKVEDSRGVRSLSLSSLRNFTATIPLPTPTPSGTIGSKETLQNIHQQGK